MRKTTFLLCLLSSLYGYSQSIDIENIGKAKPVKLTGVISANGVYYNSNQNSAREPFTYFLQGNLNVSIYGFSIPVSYSFTNQGENLDYALPFNFNRLSLHPKYKWVTAHIGDVTMTFSPYTLNGHQFTGGGVDLSPKGAFKISAMTGRLLKATPDDGDARTIPAFQRMGYGIKAGYEKKRFTVGLIGFYAKDNINSIDSIPEAKGVVPKENLVLSLNSEIKLTRDFTVNAEYAATAITQDLRSEELEGTGENVAGFLFQNRISTEYYNAVRANLNYKFQKATIGLGYERIDPGYQTLGAYFFNNDFENITLNTTNSLFNDRVTLAFNIGYQRDDLENQKANNSNRFVGAANASYVVSERLSLSGSYSNFQTFTNVKPDQFEDINDDDLLDDEIEDLDFRQLSQSATLSANYLLKQDKRTNQNIALNYALNDVANEQGGIVRIGDASTFHNVGSNYTINFIESNLDVNTGVNFTYNTIGTEDATTWGPSVSLGKRFFERTLNTRIGISYNESRNTSGKTNVANARFNAGYVFKERHNFNTSVIQLFRSGATPQDLSELTATFGYSYSFGIKKPRIKLEGSQDLRIAYKKRVYRGEPKEITPQLITFQSEFNQDLMPRSAKEEFELLQIATKKSEDKNKKTYKEEATRYLQALGAYEIFLENYDQWIFKAYTKLIQEGNAINSQLQFEYTQLLAKVNTGKEEQDINNLKLLETKFEAHSDMLYSIKEWNLTPNKIKAANGNLKDLKEKILRRVYTKYQNGDTEPRIINFIEIQLADMYHKVLKD